MPGPLRIERRAYDHVDVAALTDAVQEYYVRIYGGPDTTPVDPAEFVSPNGAFFVGYVDGHPVTMGGWRKVSTPAGIDAASPVEIKRMFVVRAARGRGYARLLLTHLEQTAAAAGADTVLLETGLVQPEAIGLYTSSGYAEVARFGHYAAEPDARHFGKRLPRLPRALVRRPSPRLAEGIVSHIERQVVDVDLAIGQWDAYVECLRDHGWMPVEVPEAPDCPDGVFVEDTMVVFGDVAVLARSGAPQRRGELEGAEEAVAAAGYRVERIREPGTLDGGDVLKIGSRVYVGRSGRTNGSGFDQIRAQLAPLGADVVAVPVTKVLHLKSAVTALPDGTVIGYPPLVDDVDIFQRFCPVEEESGAHVVLLDDRRLLMSASAPATAQQFAQLGYLPVVVDISEYEKLEGCVTCLSVRLRGH